MKKQALYYRTGGTSTHVGPPYIPLPRASADKDGIPHKGNKTITTTFFMKQYQHSQVVVTSFQKQWIPNTVLLEGIFMTQTSPISVTATFKDYSEFLVKCYLSPHIKGNTNEIHVLFDDPDQMQESPKQIERKRRNESHSIVKQHHCINIHDKDHVLQTGVWICYTAGSANNHYAITFHIKF